MTSTPKFPNRYLPQNKIFRGGQGAVHVCLDKHLNREVAIKLIQDVSDRTSIQNEITALCSIQSKHVVQIFDFFSDPNTKTIAIVQEYIPGNDLSQFHTLGLDLNGYTKALYQIASGLADIHFAGRIHRDIKPINMKFDKESIIKIFDFGLSCGASPSPVTATARGTDGFRAPELYDVPAAVTECVDTYAFGVTAWCMRWSILPSTFLDYPPLRRSPAPSFSTVAAGLSSELIELLDRTVNADPSLRPTMQQVRDALALHLLHGSHRGILTLDQKVYRIETVGKSIGVNIPNLGGFEIYYDGLRFSLRKITCPTFVNNIAARNGYVLPGSCVLTLDNSSGLREFLTFDISHPEVVL